MCKREHMSSSEFEKENGYIPMQSEMLNYYSELARINPDKNYDNITSFQTLVNPFDAYEAERSQKKREQVIQLRRNKQALQKISWRQKPNLF